MLKVKNKWENNGSQNKIINPSTAVISINGVRTLTSFRLEAFFIYIKIIKTFFKKKLYYLRFKFQWLF